MDTPESVSISDLLATAGVKASIPTPESIASEPVQGEVKEPEVQGDKYLGEFRGGDGRFLHKYILDGRQVVLPKKIEEMSDEEFLQVGSTLYDPTANRIPLNLTVKFRDKHIAGHWANRKAQDGKSVRRLQSMGFEVAKKEDCEWLPQGLNAEDGAVIDGDLVLMKIHKMKLIGGFLASYYREALEKGGQKSYLQTAQGSIGGPTNKVQHYQAAQTQHEFSGLGPIGQPLAR